MFPGDVSDRSDLLTWTPGTVARAAESGWAAPKRLRRNGCVTLSGTLALREVAKFAIQRECSFRFRGAGLIGVLAWSCSSGGGDLASRRTPAAEMRPDDFVGGDPALGSADEVPLAPLDPHSILGIDPAHGPFRGGQLAIIRGDGFSSEVRVWFGDVEVPREQVVSTRADRIQVTAPPGTPGSVAITTQIANDEATRRRLEGGYVYDPFFVEPAVGPTSGGSTITLFGSGTAWDESTEVRIDGQPCEVLAVRSTELGQQELDCRSPAGTEGSKTIAVTVGSDISTVIGAFAYEPGEALTGGLRGAPLADELTVHVTGASGRPIPGAYVILGSDFDLAQLDQPGASVRRADAEGKVVFQGPFAAPPLVTAAARCYQPSSFVDVPVDTVRAALAAVASPDCVDLEPQIFGGSPVPPVIVNGELVWRGAVEFQRAGWTTVPAPAREEERRAAYVLSPSNDPEARFRLPREDQAVTLDSPGVAGYEFQVVTGGGSRTFYALAGIENRAANPPRFTAYAMGVLRGLFGEPGETIDGVSIPMDLTLDQALTFDVAAPSAGTRGPDRLDVRVAVQISNSGFAIFPNTLLESPISTSGSLDLIGLPALVGDLAGSQYVVGARAATGVGRSLPQSVLSLITAREPSSPIAVSGFVPVPSLTVGSTDGLTWNGELGVSWSGEGRPVSVVLYEVRSGSGLVTWSIAAPPSAGPPRLPDLGKLPSGGLVPGGIEVVVSLASMEEFDYAELATLQLRRFSWDAYASDAGSGRYEPPAQ